MSSPAGPFNRSEATSSNVQKLLDENAQLIRVIVENMNTKGKSMECIQYQQTLHKNLVYLASLADPKLNLQQFLPAPGSILMHQMQRASQQQQQQQPPATTTMAYHTQPPPSTSHLSTSSQHHHPHQSQRQQPQAPITGASSMTGMVTSGQFPASKSFSSNGPAVGGAMWAGHQSHAGGPQQGHFSMQQQSHGGAPGGYPMGGGGGMSSEDLRRRQMLRMQQEQMMLRQGMVPPSSLGQMYPHPPPPPPPGAMLLPGGLPPNYPASTTMTPGHMNMQ